MSLPLVDGYGAAAAQRRTYRGDLLVPLFTANGRAAEKARRTGARTRPHIRFAVSGSARAVRRILSE